MEIIEGVNKASGNVYEIETKLKKDKNIAFIRLPQISGKKLINARHTSTGMTAVAYKDNVSGEIIIAYCGTNLSGDGFKDVLADTSIITKLIQEQAPDAVKFYKDVKKAHPESEIVLTGHSLGGGLANEVNVFTGGKNKSITFNAAPLSFIARKLAENIDVKNFTNYNTQSDPLTLAGMALGIVGIPYPNGLTTIAAGGHDLACFEGIEAEAGYRKEANKEGADSVISQVAQSNKELSNSDTIEVDVNQDGVADKVVSVKDMIQYRNLLTGSETSTIQSGGQNVIQITPEVLFHFSDVLETIANVEIPQLLANIQVMYEMNENIGKQYKNRILNGTENIDMLLQEEGLSKMVNLAVEGYELLIDHQNVIKAASEFSQASWISKLSSTAYVGGEVFAKQIKQFAPEMRELNQDLTQCIFHEEVSNSMHYKGDYITGTVSKEPIGLLKDLKKILNSMDQIVEREFQGEGHRAGYKDGLQEALRETLSIQTKNLQTVQKAVQNAASMTRIIGTHFDNRDKEIENAIANGIINPNISQITAIPISFDRYLQENNIFDDVRDVLDAWDRQIDKASQSIEWNIFSTIVEVVEAHKSKHDAVYDSVVRGTHYIQSMMRQMENKVYQLVKHVTAIPTESSYVRTVEGDTTKEYKGLIADFIGDAYGTISNLGKILETAEIDLLALSGSMNKFKDALSSRNSNLDRAIRDQIYKNANLDEIVMTQRLNRNVVQTMILEFADAINTIQSTQKGSAIDALTAELTDVKKLLEYFGQLSQSCFGD